MKQKTNHEEYIEEQMKDPEFRAYYILAKEKSKLEFMMAELEEIIKKDNEKKAILRSVRNIERHISKIGSN